MPIGTHFDFENHTIETTTQSKDCSDIVVDIPRTEEVVDNVLYLSHFQDLPLLLDEGASDE